VVLSWEREIELFQGGGGRAGWGYGAAELQCVLETWGAQVRELGWGGGALGSCLALLEGKAISCTTGERRCLRKG